MYHAHIVLTWVGFMTASIQIRWFRSNTSAQHRSWQTFSQKSHSQETDGLTLLVNIVTHTTFTQINLSVFLQLWIVHDQAWANVLVNLSPNRLARSKSHFIAQLWLRRKLTTRMPTWTPTQYLHHIIKLTGTSSAKTCVTQILKELTKRRQEH